MLNIGLSIASDIDTLVNKSIIVECAALTILSETLILPGTTVKIILAIECPDKVINTKIAKVESESNGLNIAEITYNRKMATKLICRGLIDMGSFNTFILFKVPVIITSRNFELHFNFSSLNCYWSVLLIFSQMNVT